MNCHHREDENAELCLDCTYEAQQDTQQLVEDLEAELRAHKEQELPDRDSELWDVAAESRDIEDRLSAARTKLLDLHVREDELVQAQMDAD